jgi:hypothetical protein
MALILRGSTCCLCGEVLGSSGRAEAFPAFVANRQDPLFIFSDAAVHSSCLAEHPRGQEALRRRDELLAMCGPGARVCAVCGQELLRPDDYFGTGYLADESHPLGAFNYVQLHRVCFSQWAGAAALITRLEEAIQAGVWDGPTLRVDPLPRFALPTGWPVRAAEEASEE